MAQTREELTALLKSDIEGILAYVDALEDMGNMNARQASQGIFTLVAKVVNMANHSQALTRAHEEDVTILRRDLDMLTEIIHHAVKSGQIVMKEKTDA